MPKDKKAQDTLAVSLGEIIFKNNLSNSYYNDEHYVSCKTANFDKAYTKLSKQEVITQEDLESTYTAKSDEEDRVSYLYSGLELIKMVLTADFGNQLKKTSSDQRNYECALSTWKAMCKGLGTQETQKLWETKGEKKDQEPYTSKGDYQKKYLAQRSLAQIIGSHMRWDDFDTKEESLRPAHNIAVKLRHMPDFVKELAPFSNNEIQTAIERAERENDEDETLKIKDALTQSAKHTRNKDFKKIQEIQQYYVRSVTINYILSGKSCDCLFGQELEKHPTINKLIKTHINEEDITI